MKKLNCLLLTVVIFFSLFYIFQKNNLSAGALLLEKEKSSLTELIRSKSAISEQYNILKGGENLQDLKQALGMEEAKNVSFLIIGPSKVALEKEKVHE